MRGKPMTFRTCWVDSGRTEEPCPSCGTKLCWSSARSPETKRAGRFLRCPSKKCTYRSKGTPATVRGVVGIERLNARMR